ncbi:hypothetical protein BJX61DRAFT_451920 [Aspergillus egyptiacus]|nr:hypothetical protein BJX61DRAFT_451920 [Aspergillus egyptiacus]
MTSLKDFLIPVTAIGILLQLLILANMSYLYGSAYRNAYRYSTMKVLYVDYDEAAVGQSVNLAYEQMKGPRLPTLQQRSPQEYPTERDVEQAVCKEGYWGAIYASRNASVRLAAALSSPQTAQAYDNSQALAYIWSGSRYPSYAQAVSAALGQLTQAAVTIYKQTNLTSSLPTLDLSNQYIAQTALDPITPRSIDLHPMNQGSRFYYNTVSMVMPVLIQFFFILALNGISMAKNIFGSLPFTQHTLLRFALSLIHTFIAALVMTGYIWAFREDWPVSAAQFALSWMAIWLTMQVHFLFIHFVLCLIPMPAAPFFVLIWVILNVSSTLAPFELSPGFYRWGYALPAHSLYDILLDIWTSGCNPHLYRSLPILWAEWVVALGLFVLGMWIKTRAVTKNLPPSTTSGSPKSNSEEEKS